MSRKPKPIPIYTNGDDVIISGEVKHIVQPTAGESASTAEPIIQSPILSNLHGRKLRRYLRKIMEEINDPETLSRWREK